VIWLGAFGSVSSILGLLLSIYIWWREEKIEKEVHDFKTESEKWHDE
jgi:hypothetical protein